MKVLLFVQDEGDKRPYSCGTVKPHRIGAALMVIGPDPGYSPTWKQDRAMQYAHRWWLVECENAEAGRKAICSHEDRYGATCRYCGGSVCVNYGRILASGGRS